MRTNHLADHIMICAMLLCSLAFLTVSCKKNNVADPPAGMTTPFTGITETDSTGPYPIGTIDSDDWKPLLMNCPADSGIQIKINDTLIQSLPACPFIRPVYPNPARKYFVINFAINGPDSVILTLNSTPTDVVKELINRRLEVGVHSVYVGGSSLQPAIYRVYITVFRQSDVLSSYGDVEIK
jgi:hypothetical protein